MTSDSTAAAQLSALKQHYELAPDFAVEKALRGEIITDEEFAHGTVGIPARAFEQCEGGRRLKRDALDCIARVAANG